MGTAQYYRNAGLPVPKAAPAMEPQKALTPADFAVTMGKGVVNGVKNMASSVMAAPVTIPAKVRGMVADVQRGNVLHKEGYGKYYDSSLKIAAQGKSRGK